MLARSNVCQRRRLVSEFFNGVRQVNLGSQSRNLQIATQPGLADACIDDGGFPARIGSHEEQRVRAFNAGDGCVEQIALAGAEADARTVLPTIEIGDTQREHQVLERFHGFRVDEVTDDGGHALWADGPSPGRRSR
jgi:hypothetical protein